LFFAATLGGCASALFPQSAALRDNRPAGLPERVELADVPFFPQADYQCGPAALATLLVHQKVAVTPDDLVSQVYLPARQGSLQVEMLATARRRGLVSYVLAPALTDVLLEIAAGNPVILLQDLGFGPIVNWHYAVAIGYDLKDGDIILRTGETRRSALPLGINEVYWQKGAYWSMVALPPGRLPATVSEQSALASIAAFERVDARNARAAYAAFLQRWPENAGAMIGLANAHHTLGELKEAEAALRRALARDAGSVVALNNLAQTLSDQGRHAEALPYAERAAAAKGPFQDAARETLEAVRSRLAKKP